MPSAVITILYTVIFVIEQTLREVWRCSVRTGRTKTKFVVPVEEVGWNSKNHTNMLLCTIVFSERELMFVFAICRRASVWLSSVGCRLSVTFVHPTQPIEIFGNVSAPFNTLVT